MKTKNNLDDTELTLFGLGLGDFIDKVQSCGNQEQKEILLKILEDAKNYTVQEK